MPETSQLGLQEVGVEMDKGGFVVGGHDMDHERSSVANIYAVGDVLKVGESMAKIILCLSYYYFCKSVLVRTADSDICFKVHGLVICLLCNVYICLCLFKS